jgi:hypothetical protein
MYSATSLIVVPGPKIALTPASRSAGTSSSGMIPPAVTITSSMPAARRSPQIRGSRVMWAPERIDSPTTSTSSWRAAVATISGDWRRPV